MKYPILLLLCFFFVLLGCQREDVVSLDDAANVEKPADPTSFAVFADYLESFGFFDEADDSQGFASFRLTYDQNGEVDIELLALEETGKPFSSAKADECVAGNKQSYDKCKKLKNTKFGKIALANLLGNNFGNCTCLETRSETLDDGRINVFARCC